MSTQEFQALEHEKQILECANTIDQVKEQNRNNPLWSKVEIEKLETKLDRLKKKVYQNLTPWERVAICRHPARPKSIDYIDNLCDSFEELAGDRTFRDDRAIIGGLGVIDGERFVIIAQEKGCDTESRIERNFGMPHPEGYRKAMRLMRMAAKFKLPVISLIDTPGAFPGLSAEERGQGCVIAQNLWEMSRIPTPIIVILIGEGCSGGALGMGIGDVIAILEHSYYSVISPEGCASILWKDASKNDIAAKALRMHGEDLLEFGVVDAVIDEPLGGAHHDPELTFSRVKKFILDQSKILIEIEIEKLIEDRYQKFRKLGKFIEEGSPEN